MMSEPLLISRGPLLNFSLHGFWAVHPHTVELVWYKTNEHWFQANKTRVVGMDARYLHDRIRLAAGPGEAKDLGRKLVIDIVTWDDIAPRVMLEGLLHKFTQNEDALGVLRTTGYRRLVEHRRDSIWGDDLDGTGKNYMGLALMHVREMLRS